MALLNFLFVQKKLKEERIKIFSVFDFQKFFKVKYETAKKWISRYQKKGYLIKAKTGSISPLIFLLNQPFLFMEFCQKLFIK